VRLHLQVLVEVGNPYFKQISCEYLKQIMDAVCIDLVEKLSSNPVFGQIKN